VLEIRYAGTESYQAGPLGHEPEFEGLRSDVSESWATPSRWLWFLGAVVPLRSARTSTTLEQGHNLQPGHKHAVARLPAQIRIYQVEAGAALTVAATRAPFVHHVLP
jgi:hypothetical protein